MLDWNDPLKSASPKQSDPKQAHRAEQFWHDQAFEPQPTTFAEPTEAGHEVSKTGLEGIATGAQRVDVSEKRIINATADVNQLLPLKYQWAWEKYLAGCNNHWMPTEVSMQADIALWKSADGLSKDERHMVMRNLGFLPPLKAWLPTILFLLSISRSPTLNAASTYCAKPLRKRFIPTPSSTSSIHSVCLKASCLICTARCHPSPPKMLGL